MDASQLLDSTFLPQRSFYAGPTEEVARALLGTVLVHDSPQGLVAGRIVETEAYLGENDPAAHSSAGLTPRTQVIFGPPGHAYVYAIYGLHRCLNVVAEPAGRPGCVLVRALEPLCGLEAMRTRRPRAQRAHGLANGPGKLTAAMAIGMPQNGADLLDGPLTIRVFRRARPVPMRATPRIGITKATDLALRFLIADNEFVSRR